MRVDHYECDECGVRTRRITVHVSDMPGAEDHPLWEDMHFCGTLCMDAWREALVDSPADGDPAMYWLEGQDIRDGA